MVFDTALQCQQQNVNHTSNSQQTPHTSPSRASYGVSIMGMLKKTDRVITAPQCNSTHNVIRVWQRQGQSQEPADSDSDGYVLPRHELPGLYRMAYDDISGNTLVHSPHKGPVMVSPCPSVRPFCLSVCGQNRVRSVYQAIQKVCLVWFLFILVFFSKLKKKNFGKLFKFILDPKSKQDKFKVTNVNNSMGNQGAAAGILRTQAF